MAVNWTSGLLSGYGLYDQLDRLSNIADKAVTGTNELAGQAVSGTRFKPVTVTSGFGGATVGPDGISYNQNPNIQHNANQTLQNSWGLFDSAVEPTADREAQIYEAIRATQRPEEQRAGILMDDRLSAQGRSGIRSDMYGGTPEQLAYHKAIQEAQNNASLAAIQEARAQQMQNAQLGGMLQSAAFMPQAQMQNMVNQGLHVGNLAQAGDIAGANLGAQLGLGGLQTSLNADVARANLLGNFINSAAQGIGNTSFDPVGDIASGIGGFFKDLLGI